MAGGKPSVGLPYTLSTCVATKPPCSPAPGVGTLNPSQLEQETQRHFAGSPAEYNSRPGEGSLPKHPANKQG